jgi:replicative DNA helicase
MGKTALALQIARNIAISGSKVLFFSLEMSAVSLWARMACPSEWRDFLAGKLSDIRRHDIANQSDDLATQLEHLHIVDNRQTSETIWRTVASSSPDIVIIDHLRFIKDQGENENKRQGKISETLHDLAKAFDIPVFCLVQLNRGVETRGASDRRPQLSDLRDSGEIEENADNVWMLYRESYYNTNGNVPTPTKDETELWIRKFRNGPPNIKVGLQFNAKQEWFEALT